MFYFDLFTVNIHRFLYYLYSRFANIMSVCVCTFTVALIVRILVCISRLTFKLSGCGRDMDSRGLTVWIFRCFVLFLNCTVGGFLFVDVISWSFSEGANTEPNAKAVSIHAIRTYNFYNFGINLYIKILLRISIHSYQIFVKCQHAVSVSCYY
jgi:hypothetical protein